ncbi:MAG: isocitrate/isopropylmalate family dehydrogenase, partial [Candidatus Zipacnadales bacterium]
MAYCVTLIPGDGTGPEVTEAARRCVEATGVKIEWEVHQAGSEVLERYDTPLPDHVLESIRRNRIALKGPITTPVGKGFRSVNVLLRKRLELYACVRPAKYYPGARGRYPEADLVIIRENTEDLYAGIEFKIGTADCDALIAQIEALSGQKIAAGSALSIKPISIPASERIVRFAFEYALGNGRRKVTAVHKANIMKETDGLFLQTARRVAEEEYADSGIEFEDRIVDNMCMQLVQKPELYDVLV